MPFDGSITEVIEAQQAEGVCGEFGPVRDGEIVCCSRLEADHDRRHRNCRVDPEVKWRPLYRLLRDEEGRIVGTTRERPDHRIPGPDPGQHTSPSRDQQLDEGRALLEQLEDAEPEAQTPRQQPSPQRTAQRLCEEVDELEERHCRGWFAATSDATGEEVIHACHKREEHPHPGRCECICGRRRRAESYGPLEATDRPEQDLEAFS